MTAKLQRASLSEPSNKQPEQQITENFSTPRNPKLNRQSHSIDYKFGLPQPTKPPVENEDFPLLSRGNSSIPHFPSATEEQATGSPVKIRLLLVLPVALLECLHLLNKNHPIDKEAVVRKRTKRLSYFILGFECYIYCII